MYHCDAIPAARHTRENTKPNAILHPAETHMKNFIITDRVRSRREGYVLTRVCPFIHPSVCPHLGGCTPARGSTPMAGYPTSGTPVRPGQGSTLMGGGTLMGGTPPQVSPLDLAGGHPPVRPGWGVP